jgi:hypothetical protein
MPPHTTNHLFDDKGLMNVTPNLIVSRHDFTNVFIDLGEGITIQPCYFKGEPRIEIRKWEEVSSDLRRSKKGVSLSPQEWLNLLSIKDVIGLRLDMIAARTDDVDCKYPIGGGHYITLKSPFLEVDLRRWWCLELPNFRPTTHGMRLKTPQWIALLKSAEQVTDTLSAMKNFITNIADLAENGIIP